MKTLFGNKELEAIELLKRYEPVIGYYLTFSGGKDSVVLDALAKKSGVKYERHFHNTTIEAPQTYRFIASNYPDTIWDKPEMTMMKAIRYNKMPPLRQLRYCCRVLKECHGSGRIILTGVRRGESQNRRKRNHIEVSRDDCTKIFIHPLLYWKDEEIWQYIYQNDLPINPLYKEGVKRIGCVMCPHKNSKGMKEDAIRFPFIANRYKQAMRDVFEIRKERGMNLYNWENPDDIYEWWIGDKHEEIKEGLF